VVDGCEWMNRRKGEDLDEQDGEMKRRIIVWHTHLRTRGLDVSEDGYIRRVS